jgi:hypothetical protein
MWRAACFSCWKAGSPGFRCERLEPTERHVWSGGSGGLAGVAHRGQLKHNGYGGRGRAAGIHLVRRVEGAVAGGAGDHAAPAGDPEREGGADKTGPEGSVDEGGSPRAACGAGLRDGSGAEYSWHTRPGEDSRRVDPCACGVGGRAGVAVGNRRGAARGTGVEGGVSSFG